LIEAVNSAGLSGRGGASFPTARKMASVARGNGVPVVVVNGCESEPASAKDKTLLRFVPHLVLDGAAAGAAAVGADRVVVVVERDAGVSTTSVRRAIAERNVERGVPIEVVEVPPRFVSGEESAVIHHLNGGDSKPTSTPPRPFERGVDGRPTFISNVETFAHIAQIARFGPNWFRETGTSHEPGTMLVTVSGAIATPGVYEVAMGTPLPDVVRAAGGATHDVSALLIGGYYGSWVTESDAVQARLCNESLQEVGARVGCGAVIVFPHGECGLRATAQILEWLAGETAQQCGPCMHGLPALARGANALASGSRDSTPHRLLTRWSAQIEGRGGCRMPDGAVRLLRSALTVFADDVVRHSNGQTCAAPAGNGLLALPPHRPNRDWR
jgi:NADH:ubiquinone oxidoreductase subunit F (NADH-binding)